MLRVEDMKFWPTWDNAC